jgi:hypothetical protein
MGCEFAGKPGAGAPGDVASTLCGMRQPRPGKGVKAEGLNGEGAGGLLQENGQTR